jgi:hypothetical protein
MHVISHRKFGNIQYDFKWPLHLSKNILKTKLTYKNKVMGLNKQHSEFEICACLLSEITLHVHRTYNNKNGNACTARLLCFLILQVKIGDGSLLVEKCYEHNIDIHNIFIDYTHAFDSVNGNKIIEYLVPGPYTS